MALRILVSGTGSWDDDVPDVKLVGPKLSDLSIEELLEHIKYSSTFTEEQEIRDELLRRSDVNLGKGERNGRSENRSGCSTGEESG